MKQVMIQVLQGDEDMRWLMVFGTFLVGKDATESFEDIGHSDEAREILEKYLIGELDEAVSGSMMDHFSLYVIKTLLIPHSPRRITTNLTSSAPESFLSNPSLDRKLYTR